MYIFTKLSFSYNLILKKSNVTVNFTMFNHNYDILEYVKYL